MSKLRNSLTIVIENTNYNGIEKFCDCTFYAMPLTKSNNNFCKYHIRKLMFPKFTFLSIVFVFLIIQAS
jgi:predicted nucleic acid-binding Zn finger protein